MRNLIALAAVMTAVACTQGDATSAAAVAPVVIGGEVVAPTEAAGTVEAQVAQAGSQPTAGHDGHGDAPHDARPGPLAAGESGHYGSAFTIASPPVPLSEALETCVGTGQPCLVQGTVSRVCQVSGCWFTVDAPGVDATVRIRMQDYGFFVPRNAIGANAVFEGTLSREEIPQAQAQHYADDEAAAGGERRTVDGPEQAFEFMITAVTMTMPGGNP
ncbi:MAG: DUF4920 domain-containing protein [Myxococcales bacterium]|nr:DUF4920 domain-containing protein [Myxococcales bacterium]MCB9531654.1 DUF4920 domain-containing protein [Myxococcales bacterium]